jgi:hypothetical protein
MKLKLFLLFFCLNFQVAAQIILDSDSAINLANKELAIINSDTLKLRKLTETCEECYKKLGQGQIKYQANDLCLAYYAYGSQLLSLAEKIGDAEGKIVGSFYKGLEMELRNKEAEAEKLYLQWYNLRKKEQIKTKNSLKIRWVYDYLSQFYMRTLQIEKAEKILKIWYSEAVKQKNETWTYHHVARKMGYFYSQIGEYEKAASFFELAIDENAFPISEYIVEIEKISNSFISNGQVEAAIRIDNNFLERLKKKDDQLFELYLGVCIVDKYAGANYQFFFLQKFYKYVEGRYAKNPKQGVKLYNNILNVAALPINIQRELIQKSFKYIDKNIVATFDKKVSYMEIFDRLYYRIVNDLEFELIWNEILPRIEKIAEYQVITKKMIYNRIIIILQEQLVGQYSLSKAKSVMLAIKNIEKLQNKPKQDEADKEFLLAVQKELNFARKVNSYNFWGK